MALGGFSRRENPFSRRDLVVNPWVPRKEELQNVLDLLVFLAHESQTKLISTGIFGQVS